MFSKVLSIALVPPINDHLYCFCDQINYFNCRLVAASPSLGAVQTVCLWCTNNIAKCIWKSHLLHSKTTEGGNNCFIGSLFLYFWLFSWQLTVNRYGRWLDSNCRSLVSEANALPTSEPQPLIAIAKTSKNELKEHCLQPVPTYVEVKVFCLNLHELLGFFWGGESPYYYCEFSIQGFAQERRWVRGTMPDCAHECGKSFQIFTNPSFFIFQSQFFVSAYFVSIRVWFAFCCCICTERYDVHLLERTTAIAKQSNFASGAASLMHF